MHNRFLLAWLFIALVGFAPRAAALDLSAWDGSLRTLDGTWTFYPRSGPEGTGQPLAVPGQWNAVLGAQDGWGTYLLEVVLPPNFPPEVGLFVPVVNSAVEVRWNQNLVWKVGEPASRVEAFVGGRRTGVVTVPAVPGVNRLEVRVASWGEVIPGLVEAPIFGPVDELRAHRASEINLAVFVFGCLFIMGLYHLGLFLLRPQDRTALWFGLLSAAFGFRGLVLGATALTDLVPDLGWLFLLKAGYLTFSGATLLLGLFFRDLFPTVVPRWFATAALAVAGTYSLWIVAAPPGWFTPFLVPFQLFTVAVGLAGLVFLVLAMRRRLKGAALFFVGFLVFFVTGLHDALKTNLGLPTPFLSTFGLLGFLVFQSLVVLRQFTAAFADSERYARHLVRLNSSLERFIPREVLSFLQKESIVEIELGDNCQVPMSVLFTDIRDFTTLSESMTPEQNFRFINSYLRRMGPVVRRHDGFVDKYLGDGLMALFPGHPIQALEAAVELRAALAEYNRHRLNVGYVPIRMGIGLHWGQLMLGTIGENQRMDSTVISDTVNAASRLEGLTKKWGRDILVSGEMVEALGEEGRTRFALEYLGEEVVKGRSKPLQVYTLGSGNTESGGEAF